MNCEEAAEFVSALCDGELISSDAVEHLERCTECQTRLRDYVAMGAEMRLMASSELREGVPVSVWVTKQGRLTNLWEKGWGTMRIPRLAFGLLLAAVVVLGSSLVATNARAHGDGPVVLFRISTSADKANLCPMPTTGKLDWSCGLVGADLSYKIRVVTKEGDRIKLGVQANFRRGSGEKGGGMNSDELTKLPEQTYWFIPGEKLEIPVAGTGPIEVTGEWMDHMPPIPITPNMDPKSGELRIYSPILLKGKNVAIDMEGGSATIDENDRGVVLYGKGEGRFQFALTPFEGAIKGKIALNRLTFEVDGQPYVLVTAAPISRREEAWVRLDAKFVPKDAETTGFIGGFKLNDSSAQN